MSEPYRRLIFFGGDPFGKMWKNCRFSGRLRLDWGNTTRAATVGWGSIGFLSYFKSDTVSVNPIKVH